MRVATWNINGLRARFDFLLHWLRARQPDVVALQELKLEDGEFPHLELEAAGYQAVTYGQRAWNGVAVLARHRPTVVCRGLPGQEALGARLLTVATADGLHVASVYCPNGKHVGHPDFLRKLAWLDGLAVHLASAHSPDQPLVIGGDFNLCPAPIDSWNEAALAGRIFHTAEERTLFARILAWGLVDVFRDCRPGVQAFSWWDYRAGAFHKGQGLRIDLLLTTRPVLPRVRSVEIDRDYRKKKEGLIPSDHAPVIVDLA